AGWQDGGWVFMEPREGWLAHAVDQGALLAYVEGTWSIATVEAAMPDRLGLNAAADAPNRTALAGEASLFSHEGAGHQLKINKAGVGDSATVLFQTGWSGRAEFGLAGDDDFHVKVSPDGASFTEAMVISRSSGRATFPAGVTGM